MRGVWTIVREATGQQAAANLLEIECGAKSLVLLSCKVTSQVDSSEQMTIAIKRITAAGTGGSTISPLPTGSVAQTPAFTAYSGGRNPTAAGILVRESVPSVGGFIHAPTPEERMDANGTSDGFVIRLDEALTGTHDLDIVATVMEV